MRDTVTGERRTVRTRFVFVGAGGGALPLLQRAGIPEIAGFGGFPVSGKFLRTTSPELVSGHQAKVYGQAAVGAPPMSVPHLDLRLIDGDHSLMFGPYAGFSPKFLKAGKLWDLPRQRPAGQPGLDARRGPHRAGPHPLPDPRADAVRRRPAPDPDALRARGRRRTTGRWSPPASASR